MVESRVGGCQNVAVHRCLMEIRSGGVRLFDLTTCSVTVEQVTVTHENSDAGIRVGKKLARGAFEQQIVGRRRRDAQGGVRGGDELQGEV
jgi:hypothetical protein